MKLTEGERELVEKAAAREGKAAGTWARETVVKAAKHTPPKKDACPKCGDEGEWRAMALVCRQGHGPILGGAP